MKKNSVNGGKFFCVFLYILLFLHIICQEVIVYNTLRD